jgi:hypothetical protein
MDGEMTDSELFWFSVCCGMWVVMWVIVWAEGKIK